MPDFEAVVWTSMSGMNKEVAEHEVAEGISLGFRAAFCYTPVTQAPV